MDEQLNSQANAGLGQHLSRDGQFNRRGWIFISYRHSQEGFRYASEVAALLRVAGFQVWFDVDCMTPGKILDALDRGVAPRTLPAETQTNWDTAGSHTVTGGVLILTEDVAGSPIIKDHEFSAMAKRYQGGAFALAIVNALPKLGQQRNLLDTDAGPRQVFAGSQYVPDSTYKHYGITAPQGPVELVEEMLNLLKESIIRDGGAQAGHLKCRVSTRVSRFSNLQSGDADLHIQMKWTKGSWPDRDDLERFIQLAPAHLALTDQCADELLSYSGGMHESVAFALGSIHAQRRKLEYIDEDGQRWSDNAATPVSDGKRYQESPKLSELQDCEVPPGCLRSPTAKQQRIACWVTLSPVPSRAAFPNLIQSNPGYFDRAVQIGLQDLTRDFSPTEAGRLSKELALALRELADNKHQLHLAFQGPAGMAMLLGKKLTMTEAVIYEYDKEYPGRYGPVLAVSTRQEPFKMWALNPTQAPNLQETPLDEVQTQQ